jgi:hypothetical protein
MKDEYGKVTKLTAKVLEANGFVGVPNNGLNRDWFKYKLKLQTWDGYADDSLFTFCEYGNSPVNHLNKRLYYLHELNAIDELVNGSSYKDLPNLNTISIDELIKLVNDSKELIYKVDKRKKQKHIILFKNTPSRPKDDVFATNRIGETEVKFLKRTIAEYILYRDRPTLYK